MKRAKYASPVFVIVMLFLLLSISTMATGQTTKIPSEVQAIETSKIPDWLPDNAPAPDPNSEIVTVSWYVDEQGNTVVYNPAIRNTVQGTGGSATIYWVNKSQVFWNVTSKTHGVMYFSGSVGTNQGQYFQIDRIKFNGECSGNLYGMITRKGHNRATLSGMMFDSNGISFTAPDVSASYYIT